MTAAPALAAPGDPIGSAVRIVNSVTAEIDQAQRALAQGDGVKQNEVIAAAQDAIGELRLNDETKLAIGPGASLKLDKFVYDPDKTTGSITVDLTKGAFRFITGLAKKNSYLIRSPSASISVRGTIFDVYVDAAGNIWILLHEGILDVSNTRGENRTIDTPCTILRVGIDGSMSVITTWNQQPLAREVDFETAFPFVVRPPQVDPAPRFTRVAVESGTCFADRTPPPTEQRAEAPQSRPQEPARDTPSRPPVTDYDPGPASSGGAGSASGYGGGSGGAAAAAGYGGASGGVASAATPPSQSWSGFYIGATAAAAFATDDADMSCDDPTGAFDGTPDCAASFAFNYLPSNFDLDDVGFLGGLQAGFNMRTGNLVYGLELDFAGSTLSGSDSAATVLPVAIDIYTRATQDMQWLSTLRGRIGFVNGNVLVFASGGLAVGQIDYHFSLAAPAVAGLADERETKVKVGWTAGAGFEYGLGNWSLKTEYLYYDLGDETVRANSTVGGVPNPAVFDPEFETDGHIARVGLNYHFD
ncbi:MAG: outer membrane beta-barrel protein [Hyphomicrobium sp.]